MSILFPFTLSLANQFGQPLHGVTSVLLVQRKVGQPVTSTQPGSPATASAFIDPDGSIPFTFPARTDSEGAINCYLPKGVYTFEASGHPLKSPYIERDIVIGKFNRRSRLTWKGVWNPGLAYEQNDAVTHGQTAYRATETTKTNHAPSLGTRYWETVEENK